jgi:hypothetical protein
MLKNIHFLIQDVHFPRFTYPDVHFYTHLCIQIYVLQKVYIFPAHITHFKKCITFC